ncbi:winged helix-turn-helix transcriptional regulator [Haloarcula sp. S1AR25-5A]|uniref:Winged helix-turn-helix transcriptional regulator n=1 Tax=Haloarcula terrestris TaxID=2950533 RepID=A0AAE4EWK1_9EURY|nr:winged helix-turn-helix transcriptional regulator [Haloarcula terrestris]MDS0220577.1 winged helix-turn-helix transcriptional regulator [Haloarcula terrestris]
MVADPGIRQEPSIFENKRSATRFQILLQIVEHQPAINQQEIADRVGLTPQAISDYLRELETQDHVNRRGRGRYEVTKHGVDWLISQTEELQSLVEYVNREILGEVEVEAAIATDRIDEGDPVGLSMHEGTLHASPETVGSATAVAVNSAAPQRAVGVTNVQGMLEYQPGTVEVVAVPDVQSGGCDHLSPSQLAARAAAYDCLAVAGTEALVAARVAGLDPDLRFGVPTGVREAAMGGLGVFVLATEDELTPLVEQLRQADISYELLDATEL